jgi:predicted nucleotidyltransferase
MSRTEPWQAQAVEELETILKSNNDVLALALFGSALEPDKQLDEWSDVDCLLVVQEDAYSKFFPTTHWLDSFGEEYTRQQSKNEFYATTRICFTDFRRLDILLTTPSKLTQLNRWTQIPFWRGVRILFSHSSQSAQILASTFLSPKPAQPSQADFESLVDHFWFKAMLASYKIVRHDRLIALHLALDLVRDCCVLGMMLRDRTQGTNIHRTGGTGNQVVDDLQKEGISYTPTGILDMIEHSAISFDTLALEWSQGYEEKRGPLLEWIGHIRQTNLT